MINKVIKRAHVANNSGNSEWHTPIEYIVAAKKMMGSIDTDPASSDKANKIVRAKKYFTKDDDGLKQRWKGNVWLNPPYAQPLIQQFSDAVVSKYKSKEIKQALVLVNNATETAWFQNLLSHCSALCLIKRRIKFLDPTGKPGAPLQGQVLIYLGNNIKLFKKIFGSFGKILWGKGQIRRS